MRRVYLRGRTNILKRILIHVSALNLGLIMRTAFGIGTPRTLQGRVLSFLSSASEKFFALYVEFKAKKYIFVDCCLPQRMGPTW
jgi:hypothetical protein